jgi:hypothetical protein
VRIVTPTTLLASSSLAIGRVGPFDMAFNGQPVLQVEQLLRADSALVIGRGDGPVEFSFSVQALFASAAKAVQFCALHRETIPLQTDLHVDDEDAGIYLLLADAVREIRFGQVRGSSVLVNYKFTGARFTSEDVPEDLEEDTSRMKVGVTALIEGDTEKVVTFDNPFASAPRFIGVTLRTPSGGDSFRIDTPKDDISAGGFKAKLGAAVPGSGYEFSWTAIL